jgi:hypothetical protein
MAKKLILPVCIASIIAVLLTIVSDQRGFEELAKRADVAERATMPGTKCPLSREHVDQADITSLDICLRYGLKAYNAAQRYPASAVRVFAVYGEEDIFQKIFDQYGDEVVPVVAYFVENGSLEFQVRQTVSEVFQQLWAGEKPKWQLAQLSPEQIGLIAIEQLAIRGHEMLAEFETVNGVAKRKQVTRLVFEAKDLLFGSVGDLETIIARGERLPTWKEVGLAGLDVAIVASGAGALAKAAGIGSRELVVKGTGRLMAERALGTIVALGKNTTRVAPIAFAYLVITRPALIASAGGWVAEQFGINRVFGIFGVYTIGILAILHLLWPLIRFATKVRWSFSGFSYPTATVAAV